MIAHDPASALQFSYAQLKFLNAVGRMNELKVLVADDSAIYLKLVEHILLSDSCTVLLAKSGREAFAIFEREHPALVITDWEMPDLTGIELCKKIRANSLNPRM